MALTDATVPPTGPLITIIAGDPGLGKSSMAAMFPKPLFLMMEHGLERVQPEIRPSGIQIKDVDDLRTRLREVISEEHDYQTLVIDTITSMEEMFEKSIMDAEKSNPKVKAINQALGGYGNGPKAIANLHSSIVNACLIIRERKGMNIVFLAHTANETIDLPNHDPYMRYSFAMGKHSLQPYIRESDVIGFITQEIIVRGDDNQRVKKARGTGDRFFDCVTAPWSIAKNGKGITEPLLFNEGENPLAEYL